MTEELLEEWFTLESITPSESSETLYCISVDSEDRQFLIGKTGVPTHNTEEGKNEDALKGEAAMIIGSIARLGRAAGVHLVIATQRPDATLISGETKANLGVRINCGRTGSTASSMILDDGEGARVKANPRGRLYLKIYGAGDHGQGLFAEQDWIDNYLAAQGLNPDGTPISGRRSRLANITDFNQLEGDLDAREGVDNSAVIERIREEESHMGEEDDEDWGFLDEDGDDTFTPESVADEDDEDDEEFTPPPPDPNDKMGRPEIGAKKSDGSEFMRAEDSWDTELDDLINENWKDE